MKPEERFTSRAASYAQYRPGYPEEMVSALEQEAGLEPGGTVVDIGAGTGISARLFLERGYRVIAVEPNRAMREEIPAAEGLIKIDAVGERTGLPTGCADLVICAQAFHWLNGEAARDEFKRLARPGGIIALFWNDRRKEDPFSASLEGLLRKYSPDYVARVADSTDAAMARLNELFPGHKVRTFLNAQSLDWDGLVGRMLSASYVPLAGDPNHEPFLEELKELFARMQQDGRVTIEYDCRLYWVKTAV